MAKRIKKDKKALLLASENGHFGMVKYLLENGADINSKDKDSNTALVFSSENGNLEIVKYLVENGADVNSMDEN